MTPWNGKSPWHSHAFVEFRQHPLCHLTEKYLAGVTFRLRAGRVLVYALDGTMLGRGRTFQRAMDNAELRLTVGPLVWKAADANAVSDDLFAMAG